MIVVLVVIIFVIGLFVVVKFGFEVGVVRYIGIYSRYYGKILKNNKIFLD